jgi:2'-5' RNA ligase
MSAAGRHAARSAGTNPRLFLAVDPPAETRRRAAAIIGQLQAAGLSVRWVEPAALHLTLHFLGDCVPKQRLPEVCAVVDAAAAACRPFAVTFGGVGVFPPRGRPRVLWLGVTAGADDLKNLHGVLAKGLTQLGFAVEQRPFQPHLTLGRLPTGFPGRHRPSQPVADAVKSLAAVPAGSGQIERVTLFASLLNPAGAVHHPLHTAALSG